MGYGLRDLRPAQRRAILDRFPCGVTSPAGFSPNYGYRRPDDDGRGNNPAHRPRNPSGPTPVVSGIGEITEVGGGRQESGSNVATETRRRPGRRSGRPSNAGRPKPPKPRESGHAYWGKRKFRGKH